MTGEELMQLSSDLITEVSCLPHDEQLPAAQRIRSQIEDRNDRVAMMAIWETARRMEREREVVSVQVNQSNQSNPTLIANPVITQQANPTLSTSAQPTSPIAEKSWVARMGTWIISNPVQTAKFALIGIAAVGAYIASTGSRWERIVAALRTATSSEETQKSTKVEKGEPSSQSHEAPPTRRVK